MCLCLNSSSSGRYIEEKVPFCLSTGNQEVLKKKKKKKEKVIFYTDESSYRQLLNTGLLGKGKSHELMAVF